MDWLVVFFLVLGNDSFATTIKWSSGGNVNDLDD